MPGPEMRAVLEPADLRRYDELNDAQGAMRAHWRPLIDRLRADPSPDAVRRSLELTRRLVVENGVTYNVYADPQGADRPWALDPLPFVVPARNAQTSMPNSTTRSNGSSDIPPGSSARLRGAIHSTALGAFEERSGMIATSRDFE